MCNFVPSLLQDFQTITPDFKANVNGGRYFTAQEMLDVGSYNMFLSGSPLYDATKETSESANKLFTEAFTEGFAWELLEVIQGRSDAGGGGGGEIEYESDVHVPTGERK